MWWYVIIVKRTKAEKNRVHRPTTAICAGHHLRSDAERATRLAHPVQRRRRATATAGRTAEGPRQRPTPQHGTGRLMTRDCQLRMFDDELPSEKDTI